MIPRRLTLAIDSRPASLTLPQYTNVMSVSFEHRFASCSSPTPATFLQYVRLIEVSSRQPSAIRATPASETFDRKLHGESSRKGRRGAERWSDLTGGCKCNPPNDVFTRSSDQRRGGSSFLKSCWWWWCKFPTPIKLHTAAMFLYPNINKTTKPPRRGTGG